MIAVSESQTGVSGKRYIIMGIQTTLNAKNDMAIQFFLSELDDITYGILDDNTYGLLDSTMRLGI